MSAREQCRQGTEAATVPDRLTVGKSPAPHQCPLPNEGLGVGLFSRCGQGQRLSSASTPAVGRQRFLLGRRGCAGGDSKQLKDIFPPVSWGSPEQEAWVYSLPRGTGAGFWFSLASVSSFWVPPCPTPWPASCWPFPSSPGRPLSHCDWASLVCSSFLVRPGAQGPRSTPGSWPSSGLLALSPFPYIPPGTREIPRSPAGSRA